MSRLPRIFGLGMLGLALLAGVVTSQDGQKPEHKIDKKTEKKDDKKAKDTLPKFFNKLELTDEQKTKIADVQQEYKPKTDDLLKKINELSKKYNELKKQEKQEVFGVLTATQKTKYDEEVAASKIKKDPQKKTISAQEDLAKKDLDRLQGVWQCTSIEIDGNAAPQEEIQKLKVTFKGNKASHPGPDGKIEVATFLLNPTKKPKTIDVTTQSDPDMSKKMQGIYALEGDMLKLCIAKDEGARPTEFKGAQTHVYMVLTRVKP